MKASNLNAAIRSNKGPPKMRFTSPCGQFTVELTKQSLLDSIKELSGGSRTFETGIFLGDDGFLGKETERHLHPGAGSPVADNQTMVQDLAERATPILGPHDGALPPEDDDLLGGPAEGSAVHDVRLIEADVCDGVEDLLA